MGNIIFLPAWATFTVAGLIILAIIAAVFQKAMEVPSSTDEDNLQKSRKLIAKLIAIVKGSPLVTLIIVMVVTAVYAFWRYNYSFTPTEITLSMIAVCLLMGQTFVGLSEEKKLTIKRGFVVSLIWIAIYIAGLLIIIKLVIGIIFLLLLLASLGYYAWVIKK